MSIDQDIIAGNSGMINSDVPDASHISGQVIDFMDSERCHQTVIPASEIQHFEFMRGARLVLRGVGVHRAHPISALNQEMRQVVPDEASCSRHEDARCHDCAPSALVLTPATPSVSSTTCTNRSNWTVCSNPRAAALARTPIVCRRSPDAMAS